MERPWRRRPPSDGESALLPPSAEGPGPVEVVFTLDSRFRQVRRTGGNSGSSSRVSTLSDRYYGRIKEIASVITMGHRCLLAVFCCLPLLARPKATPPAQEPFKVQVREVIVPVTVTDIKGRFVSDLDSKDFKIFDEGKEQRIGFFTRERNQPVVVGFLLDLSNASKIHWKTYQEAAIELISTLLPNDPKYSGYLITYSTDAEVAVNTTQDSEKLIDRVRKIKPGGGAALYDAIWMACTSRKLVKGEPIEPRRVIVVIGDGHDNASKKTIKKSSRSRREIW